MPRATPLVVLAASAASLYVVAASGSIPIPAGFVVRAPPALAVPSRILIFTCTKLMPVVLAAPRRVAVSVLLVPAGCPAGEPIRCRVH